MIKQTVLVFIAFQVFQLNLAQRHHRLRQPRPGAFSFQSFDQSSGFPESGSASQHSLGISSRIEAQLSSGSGLPEIQEQPLRHNAVGNDVVSNSVANLPLYKQSFPGLYVKGYTAESFKYEPTRQVAHHHGPNYQIPRNIASSSPEQNFADGQFPSFN